VHGDCKQNASICKEYVKGASRRLIPWHYGDMTILLIDDDRELCELMSRFLHNEGFEVSSEHDGESGLARLQQQEFELAIVDIMMPKMNGMDLLRELRQHSNLPVIMLTARGEDMDRIIGLELGADDYLAKPCNPRELAARIRAVLRRTVTEPDHQQTQRHCFGTLEWLPQSRTIALAGATIDLTATEYNILAVLLQHHGEVVNKQTLSETAMGKRYGPFDRTLDVHIGHLRKKLIDRDDDSGIQIKTVRGVGWLLAVAT